MKINKFLISVLFAAFILRAGFIFLVPHQAMCPDSQQYNQIALNLLAGNGYSIEPGQPTARRAPGYPLFLMIIYFFFSESSAAVQVFQALVSTVTCLVLYKIAGEYFSDSVSKIVLVSTAVYPVLIAYDGYILTESVFAFFMAASILALIKSFKDKSFLSFFISGIILALANLVRPDLLLFPAAVLIMLVIKIKEKRKALILFSALMCGILLAFLPWTARNYAKFHRIFVGQSGGLGPLVYSSANYALRNTTDYDREAWSELKESHQKTNGGKSAEEMENRFLYDGLSIIAKNPLKYAVLLARRLPKFWITSHSSLFGIDRDNSSYISERKYIPIALKMMLLGLHMAMLILAGAGLWLERKRFGELMMLIFVVLYSNIYILLDSPSRHHVPFIPFILLFSSAAIAYLFRTTGGLVPAFKNIFKEVTHGKTKP